MSEPIKTLQLIFDLPLGARQIAQWRGAFIQMAGWEDELFHNHNNQRGNYHYRYPLIQYRSFKGKAAIFAINEGVNALHKVLASNQWTITWEGCPKALQVADIRVSDHYLKMTKVPQKYQLFQWLALNEQGHREWQNCNGAIERILLLQRKLQNHLIGCFKGLNWNWPERIEVAIEFPNRRFPVKYHDAYLMAFDIAFSTNVLLPNSIAIGKGVSHGFGWIIPEKVLIFQHKKQLQKQVKKDKVES
ncbi:MAG: CRISPR-associated endonuclease Cas6 [Bacteroidota bacterium]